MKIYRSILLACVFALTLGLINSVTYANEDEDGGVVNDDLHKLQSIAQGEVTISQTITRQCYNGQYEIKISCSACEESDASAALAAGGSTDGMSEDVKCATHLIQGTSILDATSLNHHHYAKDYKIGRGSASCTSCGSGVGSGAGLFDLYLERRHRYRDMTTYSSFGPGVFSTYDTKLSIYEFEGGTVADLFDPRALVQRRFVDGLEGDTKDGVLQNLKNKGFKDLRLLDNTDTLTSSLASAEKAVLTLHNGVTHTFELMQTESFTGIVGGQSVDPLINPDALPDVDYIAHWEFDENSGTTAGDSEGAYDGTISGASWVTSTAPSGGAALSFDGTDDEVNAGNVPVGSSGNPQGGFTAAFWVNPDSTQIRNNPVMLSKYKGASGQRSFMVDSYKNGGNLKFHLYFNGTNASTLITPQQVLVRDKWQHVAVSYDGSFQRIFVNGQQVAQSQDHNTPFTTARSADLIIGSRGGAAYQANGFVGEMDDVRLYDRALIGPEIQALMQRELQGSYDLEENTGLTTADGSGNGNDGTLFGGASWTTSGYSGNAIDFDGIDDGVSLGNDISLLSAHWITVSAWIKPDTLANASTGDGSRNVVDRGDGVFLRIKDGQYQFGTSSVGFIHPAKYTAPTSDVGEWVHLAGTYDGQFWRLYRNGVLVAEQYEDRGSSSVSDDWVIGNTADGTEPFDGVIDSVRIYNDTLSADEIVSMSELPLKSGRLIEVADRNGFAKTLTYRDADFTAQELIDAPDRRWQINTVTDAYGRVATFNYKSAQESGRWVVERVDLPNGQDIDYAYDDGKLSKVTHADGTESTFAYGVDSTSQTTTVQYNDASAERTHRNKTVYLTNVVTAFDADKTSDVYSQASLLARMVVNGNNEVSLLAIPVDQYSTLFYKGKGRLAQKYKNEYMRSYDDDWQFVDPDNVSAGISGTQESTYGELKPSFGMKRLEAVYPKIIDQQGLEYSYQYDSDTFMTRKTYPDNSKELWEYNGFKQVTKHTDRLGRQTVNTYDTEGNLLSREVGIINGVNQPEYAEYEYAYYNGTEGPAVSGITGAAATQPKGLKKSDTDANGNVTNYVYDSNNFRIAMISPADRVGDDRAVTLYSYDGAGRMSTVTDPLGRVTTFGYDSRDRQKTVTYEDGSIEEYFYANELTGGAGNQANLLVAMKDRNDNYSQYRYDNHGRRVTAIRGITSETDALNQSFIPDTTYHDVEECVYLDGTDKKIVCTRNGERTTYLYDYRYRQVASVVFPREAGAFPHNTDLIDPDGAGPLAAGDDPGLLKSTTIYKGNLRFATVDPYGRATFYAYRSSDSAMIRTVREAIPGGSGIDLSTGTFTDVINLTRDLSYEDAGTLGATTSGGGSAYLITDMVKDAEAQTTSTVDPRNIQHDTVYDSRSRIVESVTAVGTTVEAISQMVYDAQSNVTESRSARYFDSGDTEGFNKAFATMTYTGRNLLASRTVAAGDTTYDAFVASGGTSGLGAKATEEMFYYLDGRHEKTVDFNGNDPQFIAADHEWLSVWRQCCERIRATIDPEGHGNAQGTDFNGNVAHTAVVDSLIDDVIVDGTTGARTIADSDFNGIPGYWDAPDTRTLSETTTRFDSKNRPVASTFWLDPLDLVDPNDPPILYSSSVIGGTRAQSAVDSSQDGLTTLYYYSEDLYETPVVTAGVEGVPTRGPSQGNTILVHQFAGAPAIDLQPMLNELSNDSIEVLRDEFTNASAMATINPEGEISVTIMDGAGRAVISAMLDPTNNSVVTWSTVSHDRISDAIATSYGETLETLSISALDHLNRSFTDGAYRTVESEDAQGEIVYAIYDNNGNAIRTRDANDVGQDCDFDARNRDISCTDTQGDTTTYTYNGNNQVLKTTDAKGVSNKADTVYDARGRVIQATSRLSVSDTNKAAYDPNSNLLTQTDAEGGVTTYEYNPRNLRTATFMPGHNPSSVVGDSDYDRAEMTYDAQRRLRLKTDQQGDTCVYTYDLANRLTTKDYRLAANSTPLIDGLPTGTIADTDTLTYDDSSKLLSASSSRYSNTVTRSYDNIGRRQSEGLHVNFGVSRTYAVSHQYDDDNRRIKTVYPNTKSVDRAFTDRNLVDQIDYDGAMVADYSYDAGMRETQRQHGNGLYTRFVYGRGDNLLTSIVNETNLNASDRPDASFDYSYDANKNVVSEITGGSGSSMEHYSWSTLGGVTAGYDAEDRLTYWSRSLLGSGTVKSQEWPVNYGVTGLSLVGNWDTVVSNGVAESRSHNSVHELTAIGGNALAYDAKGNQLRKAGDSVDRFNWDFDNQLQSADVNQDGVDEITYTYDALGRRVSKNDGSTHTVYVCSGDKVVCEYLANTDPSTASAREVYVYGTYVDEPLMKVDSTHGNLYYHSNRQYSVSALTNSSGVVVERYAYTTYGVTTVLAADGSTVRPVSVVGNSYMYTGRRLDSELASSSEFAIYFYRARYYDPQQGRFISRDPLGYIDGASLYAGYFAMRGGLDPYGYCDWCSCLKHFLIDGLGKGAFNEVRDMVEGLVGAVKDPVAAVKGLVGSIEEIVTDVAKGEIDTSTLRAIGLDDLAYAIDGKTMSGKRYHDGWSTKGCIWKCKWAGRIIAELAPYLSGSAGGAKLVSKLKGKIHGKNPTKRGRKSEDRVLSDMGETKNTDKYTDSSGTTTIPDFDNPRQVGDIKDTKSVSDTKQMKAQREKANSEGKEHVVVTGENTHVTGPMERSGSTIVRRKDLGPQNPSGVEGAVAGGGAVAAANANQANQKKQGQ